MTDDTPRIRHRPMAAGGAACSKDRLGLRAVRDAVEQGRVLTALPRAEDGHDFRQDLTSPP
jgi:hypothetical protein